MKKGILYFLAGVLCLAVSALCSFFFIFSSSIKRSHDAYPMSDLQDPALVLFFGLAAVLLLGGLFLVPYGVRKISTFDRGVKKKAV